MRRGKHTRVLALILTLLAFAPVYADHNNGNTGSFDLDILKNLDAGQFCDLFAKNQLCKKWSTWGLGPTCDSVLVGSNSDFCELVESEHPECKVDDSGYSSYDNILNMAEEMPKYATGCYSAALTQEYCEKKDGCSYSYNSGQCLMPHDAVIQFYAAQNVPYAAYLHTYYKTHTTGATHMMEQVKMNATLAWDAHGARRNTAVGVTGITRTS
jgi:hypothetical protein